MDKSLFQCCKRSTQCYISFHYILCSFLTFPPIPSHWSAVWITPLRFPVTPAGWFLWCEAETECRRRGRGLSSRGKCIVLNNLSVCSGNVTACTRLEWGTVLMTWDVHPVTGFSSRNIACRMLLRFIVEHFRLPDETRRSVK